MSSVSRGNGFENQIAGQFRDRGWLVASRRHHGGAGDLLAIGPRDERWLVECKTTKAGCFSDFGPAKRAEMRAACERFGLAGWLVWHPPGGTTRWVPMSGWPD